MSFRLSAERCEQVAEALRQLTEIKTRLGVVVCAYGGIDIEIIEITDDTKSGYARIEWDHERMQYVLEEQTR